MKNLLLGCSFDQVLDTMHMIARRNRQGRKPMLVDEVVDLLLRGNTPAYKNGQRQRQQMSQQQQGGVTVGIAVTIPLGGVAFSAPVTVTGDAVTSLPNVSQIAAQPGVVATHTSGTAIIATMTNSNHGIANGQRCDIYWSGGFARGVPASSVSGTSVTLSGGTWSATAPATTTAINVALASQREFSMTNANVQLVAVQCNWESVFDFLESDYATENWYQHLVPSSNGQQVMGNWYNGSGVSNPLSNTTTAYLALSHADPAAAHVMQAAALMST